MVDRGFPLVLIDRYVPDLAVDTVTMDNVSGGFQAVQHLAQLGYRRIGYVGTDNLGTSSIVERMAGYRWALEQYGLPFEPGPGVHDRAASAGAGRRMSRTRSAITNVC